MSEEAQDRPAQDAEPADGATPAEGDERAEASSEVEASPPPEAPGAAPAARGKPLEEWAAAAVIMTIIGALFWFFFAFFRG